MISSSLKLGYFSLIVATLFLGWEFCIRQSVKWGSSAYYLNLFALVAGFFNFSFALFSPNLAGNALIKTSFRCDVGIRSAWGNFIPGYLI